MKNKHEIDVKSKIVPRRDIVFKALFGSTVSVRKGFLKNFLEALLKTEIASLTVNMPTELIPDFYSGKKSIVDVRAKLADGTNINIEVQSKAKDYSDKRCLQHWSKIYANDLQKSHDYTESNKTICIWIINENVVKDLKNDYISNWRLMDPEHGLTCNFQEMGICIIELKKLKKYVKVPLSALEMWLAFIDYTDKELVKMACEQNEVIREAQKELNKLKADPRMQELIEMEEFQECDRITSINQAMRDGINKRRKKAEKKDGIKKRN